MSFGGRSLKREELRFKKELRQMTRQSQHEYSSLPAEEKAKLLATSPSSVAETKEKRMKSVKKSKLTKRGQRVTDSAQPGPGEIPPPSPSIDLGLEFRNSPDIETPRTTVGTKENEMQGSVATGRQTELQSVLTGRSTGAASIRAKVDLNVVMKGKGVVDEEQALKASRLDEQYNRKVRKATLFFWHFSCICCIFLVFYLYLFHLFSNICHFFLCA